MSWYTDLITSAREYLNTKVSFFSKSHKDKRAAHLYAIQSLPVPVEGQVPAFYSDVLSEAQKTQIQQSLHLLSAFPVYAKAVEIQSEAALLFGDGADKPTNHWALRNNDFQRMLLEAATNIAALPIPAIRETPVPLEQHRITVNEPQQPKGKISEVQQKKYDEEVAAFERLCEESEKENVRRHGEYNKQVKLYNQQLNEQISRERFKQETQQNLSAAYVCSKILGYIRDFEFLVFNGETVKAKEKLQQLGAYLDSDEKKHLHYGDFTGSVLAKLILVQARINAQFSPAKYDEENASIRITHIIDKFHQRVVDTIAEKYRDVPRVEGQIQFEHDDMVRMDRLARVRRLAQGELARTDVAEYKPWWGARAWRAFKSIFTTSSNYVNEKPKQQAWSIVQSEIINSVVPAFLKNGSEGVKSALNNASSLGRKINPQPGVPAPDSKVEREINSCFAQLKNKVETILDTNPVANPNPNAAVDPSLSKLISPNQINTDQTGFVVKLVADNFLFSPYITPSTPEKLVEPSNLTSLQAGDLVCFPEWPTESPTPELAKNENWMKSYAEKIGKSIHQALTFGTLQDFNYLQEHLLANKFLAPAVFNLYDISKVRHAYMSPAEKCIGLSFYKHLFKEIFALSNNGQLPNSMAFLLQPEDPNEHADVKRCKLMWKQFYQFNNYLNLYDIESKKLGTRNPANNQFTEIETRTADELSAFLKSFGKLLWTKKVQTQDNNQVVEEMETAELNGSKIELHKFYFDLADLRRNLRAAIVRPTGSGAEHTISEEQQTVIQMHIKKLQEESYLGDKKCINDVSAILLGKIYNGLTEIKVEPKVRLLAALNALANQFSQFPAYSDKHTYQAFFDNEDLRSSRIKWQKIIRFIRDNKLAAENNEVQVIKAVRAIYERASEWSGMRSQGQMLSVPPSPVRTEPPSRGSSRNSPPGGVGPSSSKGAETLLNDSSKAVAVGTPGKNEEKKEGFFARIGL